MTQRSAGPAVDPVTEQVTGSAAGLVNFRPVVGTTPDGGILPGLLYRSASLEAIGDPGRLVLHDLGIRTVLDLRTTAESDFRPSDVAGLGIAEVRVPLVADMHDTVRRVAEDDVGPDAALERAYTDLLENGTSAVAAALHAMAEAPLPTVVVCAAGKDRTGILVALLQLTLGVGMDEVVAGYAVSESMLEEDWLDAVVERFASIEMALPPAAARLLCAAPPTVLREVIAHLVERHGSIDTYLESIGVGADTRSRLRERFVGHR